MRFPDEVRVVQVIDGVTVEFAVRDVSQGFLRLFPGLLSADEFLESRDLRVAVSREAAAALDLAAEQFLREFERTSSSLLIEFTRKLMSGTPGAVPGAEPTKEAA